MNYMQENVLSNEDAYVMKMVIPLANQYKSKYKNFQLVIFSKTTGKDILCEMNTQIL